MQLKKIFFILSLSVCLFAMMSRSIKASCDFDCAGLCNNNCGYVECTTGAYICDLANNTCGGECVCDPGWVPKITCIADQIDPNATYWSPTPGTTCQTTCERDTFGTGCGCIQETATLYCGPCTNPGDPTPTPNPGDPNPTSTHSFVNGRIQQDQDAYASGAFCAQNNSSPIDISGWSVALKNPSSPSTTYPVLIQGSQFSINTTSAGSGYTLTLDLTSQSGGTNYVCSCPAPIDQSNPYLCRYTGLTSPSDNINFYLKEYNLSNNSWFQVFGANVFAKNAIASNIPYAFCALDANCQAALSVPVSGSTNPQSSGFTLVNSANPASITSSAIANDRHHYLHLASKTLNQNAYVLSTNLSPLSYDYFYQLAEKEMHFLGDGEDLEPLLSDWTSSPWWRTDEVNYVKITGNVNIDETQGFYLNANQRLVVFVDGNLILDDSNPADANRKITSVASGGFLAFLASGNIIISADVGHELNPLIPSTPPVSIANSHVEGVFVANRDLIIQSKTAIGEVPPDRKFIGAGTFVGWHNVLLERTFNDNNFGAILNNTQAIDNFVYRADLLANWPVKLRASTSHWREIEPQFIGQ